MLNNPLQSYPWPNLRPTTGSNKRFLVDASNHTRTYSTTFPMLVHQRAVCVYFRGPKWWFSSWLPVKTTHRRILTPKRHPSSGCSGGSTSLARQVPSRTAAGFSPARGARSFGRHLCPQKALSAGPWPIVGPLRTWPSPKPEGEWALFFWRAKGPTFEKKH